MRQVKFSVIIPLGFHRGQTMRCVKLWTQGQMFPRKRFQVVIAAPETYPEDGYQQIRLLLAPQDRIERFSCEHDIALLAAGVKQAEGDVFLFTEAHALPERNTLERVDQVMVDHPNWSGFSFRSVPDTHNLLSEIEAEMYHRHIERNMMHHPWLKVLDQCLVVTRNAYCASGGIEPEYGHFSEWLFAARLFHAGQVIGFNSGPVIHHYYVGKLRDIEVFTLDFAEGEASFRGETRRRSVPSVLSGNS